MATRSKNEKIFGFPDILPQHQLPTIGDVLRLCEQNKFDHRSSPDWNRQELSNREMQKSVSQDVFQIYDRATVAAKTFDRSCQMVLEEWKKSQRLVCSKNKKNFPKLLADTKQRWDKLFDLVDNKNLDPLEASFVDDQRSERKRFIGCIDEEETSKRLRKLNHKTQESARVEREKRRIAENEADNDDLGISSSSASESENASDYYDEDEPGPSSEFTRYNTMKCQNTAREADRKGVSDETAAALATSGIQDYLGKKFTMRNVIDPNKIRRHRTKRRLVFQESANIEKEIGLEGLYFDGKKDDTYVLDENGHRRKIKEEHYVILKQPGNIYITHISPSSGASKDIFEAMKSEAVISQHIKVVGSDGTAVNTGNRKGVISLIEKEICHEVHWNICFLHINELPLRHLIQSFAPTSGPESFVGEIGRIMYCDLTKLPIIEFQAIEGRNFPENIADSSDLSTDQQYLFEICMAVSKGECTENLAKRDPGNYSHARWLTGANRILRSYISDVNPSEGVKIISWYIINVYAPVWFESKRAADISDAPRLLFLLVKFSREIPCQRSLKIVQDSIKLNCYAAHCENLLYAMFFDDRPEIRELAVRRIQRARETRSASVRKFIKPAKLLNFEATDYNFLIQWQKIEKYTPPPLLEMFATETLFGMIKTKPKPESIFPPHSQSVERMIRVVSDVSTLVIGKDKRDSYIRSIIDAREKRPVFKSRQNYVP